MIIFVIHIFIISKYLLPLYFILLISIELLPTEKAEINFAYLISVLTERKFCTKMTRVFYFFHSFIFIWDKIVKSDKYELFGLSFICL